VVEAMGRRLDRRSVVARAGAPQDGGMARARLTSLDGSFLRVETCTAHMHVAWKGRFRPRGDGSRPALAELRASVAGRLGGAPRFRQRLAFPPAGLGEPVWVDDPAFAVEHHVVALSEASLPRERFDALCDLALSVPLDRGRPLWEIHLAPRLDDGSVGLLMKVHHAMVDGMSAVELALLLLDVPGAEREQAELAGWHPAEVPSPARLAADAIAERSADSLRAASRLARLAASPRGGVRLADTLRRTALAVGEDLLRPAPSSYVNVPISARRTLVHHTAKLEPLLDARTRLGVTLNDVALAVVAGALRDLAIRAGRVPAELKVMVPVSTRRPDEAAAPGNRISFAFIDLPVHLRHAGERVEAIHEQTTRFKRTGKASGAEAVLGALGALPEPLRARAARMAASARMYNLTISNVPGPRFTVELLGCELMEAVPVIPIPDEHALAVGVFTHGDRISFGAYADPAALPEVTGLPHAIGAAILEVEGVAARRGLRAVA
jgi:WS/DGAT/MGAT family acyltransferase